MSLKLAVDFGTTNSVIARWDDSSGAATIETLPGITSPNDKLPPLIPSWLYVQDGQSGDVTIGQAVRQVDPDRREDHRLFQNFKRHIVTTQPVTPRQIDGVSWSECDAGRRFLRTLIMALPFPLATVDQLVLTVPVAAFGQYIHWLSDAVNLIASEKVRVVDESTAAALGYAVTEPGSVVMVLDFGGGTLDLSLVQLPESKEKTGGLLGKLRRGKHSGHTARVIAKAGRVIGGSDVDQWLLSAVLEKTGLPPQSLGDHDASLLAACEQAKIALSQCDTTEIAFTASGQSCAASITRQELETILNDRGFLRTLHHTINKVMHVARRQGIFKEDIRHVLLVGGTSLMPAVQTALGQYFSEHVVRADKPFTAVAEGALQIAVGFGLDDYLPDSYGLRHLDPATGRHAYEEIIPEGSRYPSVEPVEVTLRASCPDQQVLELGIGSIGAESIGLVEVQHKQGQTVFVAHADTSASTAGIPLNADSPFRIKLDPPGQPDVDRIRVSFRVDDQRHLRVTIRDLQTKKRLHHDEPVTTLGASTASSGHSLIPDDVEDLAAYFRNKIQAATSSMQAESTTNDRPGAALSGQEPSLGREQQTGMRTLSLRRLGVMLNMLPPDAVTLDAASAMLASSEFYVRYNAGKMLARRGDRPARIVLAKALNSTSAPTRASAARHLYGFSWHTACPLIRRALADTDHRVCEAAIYALCDMRHPHAFYAARAALQNAVDDVRAAAAWGLRECPLPEAVPVLEAVLLAVDPEVRVQAMEALGANGTADARRVIRQAIDSDPDGDVHYAATLSLIELAEETCLPEICDLIRTTAGHKRAAILRALFHATNYLKIRMADTGAMDQLLDALDEALHDPLPQARMAAVWPLAWSYHDRATCILTGAFQREPDHNVREHMVRVCTSLMSPAAASLIANHN